MGTINLSDEDKQKLLQALNEEIEPPAEVAEKLFPGLFTRLQEESRLDVKSLQRAKIPTIEYEGKRSEAAILNSAALFGGQSPLQLVRSFEEGRLNQKTSQLMLIKESGATYDEGWRNFIVSGDNRQFLKTCYLNQDPLIKNKVKGKVNLIYIDPPFATKGDFATKEGEDSYADKIDRAEFIEELRERLIFLRELLSADGSIYVHLDQKMNHYIKIILDELFGKEGFKNQIVWRNTNTHNKAATYGRIHQNILFYSHNPNPFFKKWKRPPYKEYIESNFSKDEKGRYVARADLTAPETRTGDSGKKWSGYDPTSRGRHWAIPAFVYDLVDEELQQLPLLDRLDRLNELGLVYFPEKKGGQPRILKPLTDDVGNFFMDIWAYQPYTKGIYANSDESIDNDVSWSIPNDEATGYPTQKPEGLLARIIRSSTKPGDLVMDPFAGSGTTAAVAEKMGRRWIVCDFGKHAVYTIQKRIIEIGDSRAIQETTWKTRREKYSRAARPFSVLTVGAYEFSKIMNLRENQDAYVSFVLEMFGIADRANYEKRYNLNHVYGQKDGNPVTVFPVWEDEYLKNIRIDEEYLKGLLDQTGGKLKGDVYIICPETCTTVSDTEIKNSRNQKVTFRILTFPYKVLEEVSRNFQIEEQPSSADNINNLVSSVGFYFNQEVTLKVKKSTGGFEIKEYDTAVTDREGNRFDGLDGLAMMLVDADYDGEVFKIDAAIYQKDIKNNKVTLKGLGPRSALIAIDKFGNESKIAMLK